MAKTVKFGVIYTVQGRTSMEVPDDIVAKGIDATIAYIENHFDNVHLPVNANYIPDSDALDLNDTVIVED